MQYRTYEDWLDAVLPKQNRLTQAVVTIIENLLDARGVEYLAVTGRTKEKAGAIEKIRRKGYGDPARQLTDLSGVRIVVFFESDVRRVSKIIEESFSVDAANSLNKDDLLLANQIGYRSVHFVCDLGKGRTELPEFEGLADLTFEVQVRTILQHAWAELAHDRNYKFSGKLPREVERKMYLYAGMLEIADKGFDELSSEIDKYVESLQVKSDHGDLSSEINSLSLQTFVRSWAKKNNFPLDDASLKDDLSLLVDELAKFGVSTLADLNAIIPRDYCEYFKPDYGQTTIYGVVRDWMLVTDWHRLIKNVECNWIIPPDEMHLYKPFVKQHDWHEFNKVFGLPRDYEEEVIEVDQDSD